MKKILVVDDDINLLNYLHEELTSAGYYAQPYSNGGDALVAAAEQEFDLVLLDMLMPGIDGIQMIRILRKIAPNLPVIGLTGYVGRGYLSQAMSLGVNIFTKPISMTELIRQMEAAITGSIPAE